MSFDGHVFLLKLMLMTMSQMKNLGALTGELLVFGGVYSNLQALEAMKEVAEQRGIAPSHVICTGDIVAYCAQPEECVQFVKEWGIHCILGNVEIQLRDGLDDCACDFTDGSRCDTFSKQWYPFAQSAVSQNNLDWMQTLPHFLRFRYGHKEVVVVHGSYHHTSEFIFASSDWKVKSTNFQATQADVILAGHSGLPFSQQQEGNYWLNAGVIGMPANDGTPRVWYMTLQDQAGFEFEHHALEYDYQQASKLMLENHLPPTYAETLQTGIWDNCEILPATETALQGQEIHFEPVIVASAQIS